MIETAALVLLAESMGVRVKWCRTLSVPAKYVHAERTIYLLDGRADMPTRCSLAHEIGHAYYGHEDDGHYAAQERAADEYAARLLISEAEYAIAEALVGHEPGAIAKELDVAPHLVHAWRRARKAA